MSPLDSKDSQSLNGSIHSDLTITGFPDPPATLSTPLATTISGPISPQSTKKSSDQKEPLPGDYGRKTLTNEPKQGGGSLTSENQWTNTSPPTTEIPSNLITWRPRSQPGSSPTKTEANTLLHSAEPGYTPYDPAQMRNSST